MTDTHEADVAAEEPNAVRSLAPLSADHQLPRLLPPPRPASGGVRLRRLLVVLDTVAASVAWSMALLVASAPVSTTGLVDDRLLSSMLLTGLTMLAMASQRLHLARTTTIRAVEIRRLGHAVALSAVAGVVLDRALPLALDMGRLAAGSFLCFALILAARSGYRSWLLARRRDGGFVRPVVVVGANDEGFDLCKLVGDHPELGYRVVGVVGHPDDIRARDFHAPYLGPVGEAVRVVHDAGANGVILAATALEPAELNRLVRAFMRGGLHVHLSTGINGIDSKRVRAQPIAHEPLFYVEPLHLSRWQHAVKRAIDLAVTTVGGLLVGVPVLVLAAIAIKLQDRGPVLFKHQRVGRYGEPFTVYKLRTMVPNAEKLYDELAATHAGRDGPLIKLVDDPRRTKVGRFLERTSIDELPQLFNVLRGDMSLVGPRPAQAREVAQFDDELLQRLEVRPGITGLWQVEARDNPSYDAYRRYDLFYIENWSVGLDLAILVATFQRVLVRGVSALTKGRSSDFLTRHSADHRGDVTVSVQTEAAG